MVGAASKRPGLMLALACHVAFSVGYLLLTPVFEGPDENEHYRYAFHIANTGELPVPRGRAAALGRPLMDEMGLVHHPPMYYRFLALTMTCAGWDDLMPAPWSNERFDQPGQHLAFRHGSDEVAPVSDGVVAFRWLRGWSVVFGLLSILFVHRLGAITVPDRPAVADVAALLVACLPMWSFMHGLVNAANLSVLWCQAALVLAAGCLAKGRLTAMDGFLGGAVLSLALRTQLTGLFLVVVFCAVAGYLLYRRKGLRGEILRATGIAVAVVLVVAGPQFWSNLTTFGDPLMLAVHRENFAATKVPEGRTLQWLMEGFFPNILISLLGQFGWFSLPPHRYLVWGGALCAVVALFGLFLALRRGEGPRHFAFLGGTVLLVFALTLRFNLEFRQPQARLLFPAIGPLAVLVATGIVAVLPRVRTQAADGARVRVGSPALALLVVPPAIGFAVLAWHFQPAFDPTRAPAPAQHLSLVTGALDPPVHPRIALQVASGNPPKLTWREPGSPRTPYTIYVFDRRGRIWGGTYEWTPPPKTVLRGPDFVFPAEWWGMLPRGREYGFKVRRLPDRATGIWPPDLPESNIVWLAKDR